MWPAIVDFGTVVLLFVVMLVLGLLTVFATKGRAGIGISILAAIALAILATLAKRG